MTAVEKAQELVNKMYDEMFYYKDGYSSSDAISAAKKCALIAVDEALSEYVKRFNKMKQLHSYMLDAMQSEGYNYWQEVKQEIINL